MCPNTILYARLAILLCSEVAFILHNARTYLKKKRTTQDTIFSRSTSPVSAPRKLIFSSYKRLGKDGHPSTPTLSLAASTFPVPTRSTPPPKTGAPHLRHRTIQRYGCALASAGPMWKHRSTPSSTNSAPTSPPLPRPCPANAHPPHSPPHTPSPPLDLPDEWSAMISDRPVRPSVLDPASTSPPRRRSLFQTRPVPRPRSNFLPALTPPSHTAPAPRHYSPSLGTRL